MSDSVKKILLLVGVPFLVALSIVLAFILALSGLAIYGHRAAERAGNEVATIQNLKTIGAVEYEYFNTHKRAFATFEELVKDGLLSSRFTGNPVQKDGYKLRIMITPASANSPSSFIVTADPIDASTGRNHFYLDSSSAVIRINPDGPAGPSDPPKSES